MTPQPTPSQFMRAAPPPFDQVDHWVNTWVGTPHVYDGRTLNGIDCYGLVWRFYHDLYLIELPDWQRADHSRLWVSKVMARQQRQLWRPLAMRREPCVALITRSNAPHHMGIAWRNCIVHAVEGGRVQCDNVALFAAAYGWPEWGDIDPSGAA